VSQENVEFIRNLLSGAEHLDKQALLAVLPELIAQTCHPDIEWVEHLDLADRRVYRGHQGVQESWERWLEQWGEYGFEVERLIDCGDDVLLIAREHGSGLTSGADVSSRIYCVFTVRSGKVARYREFYDERAALEAVGLSG
jgi:ketosteroid isomerase-like protein